MSNQPLKSFQALRGKQKQRVNEWLFKEILLYCIHHQEEMDEREKKRLAQRFCDRVRSLSAQISEEDALKIIEKRLPGLLERARNETEQRSQLLPSLIPSSNERLSSRQKWAQDFSRPIGSGDALIKGYKRQFGLDRVNAMKEFADRPGDSAKCPLYISTGDGRTRAESYPAQTGGKKGPLPRVVEQGTGMAKNSPDPVGSDRS